jgi:hypothetical protein
VQAAQLYIKDRVELQYTTDHNSRPFLHVSTVLYSVSVTFSGVCRRVSRPPSMYTATSSARQTPRCWDGSLRFTGELN